jgi:hypothetical protein
MDPVVRGRDLSLAGLVFFFYLCEFRIDLSNPVTRTISSSGLRLAPASTLQAPRSGFHETHHISIVDCSNPVLNFASGLQNLRTATVCPHSLCLFIRCTTCPYGYIEISSVIFVKRKAKDFFLNENKRLGAQFLKTFFSFLLSRI